MTSQHRGTQRKILRKRPKNINKAWIKLSEAILEYWESSGKNLNVYHGPLLARLKEEFPDSKVHLQPATLLTGKFPSKRISRHYWPLWVKSKGIIKGERGCWKIAEAAIVDMKSPHNYSELYFSQQHFPSRDTWYIPHLPASKNLPEEQTSWGTYSFGFLSILSYPLSCRHLEISRYGHKRSLIVLCTFKYFLNPRLQTSWNW